MIFYHSTSRENAARIVREGFRDRTDYYMTSTLHTGVWLSDLPLDENEGASSEARLCLELDEARIAPFEWIEDGKGYREFLVPAAIVNTGKVRGLDGLTYTLAGKTRAPNPSPEGRRRIAIKASKAAIKARTRMTKEPKAAQSKKFDQ
jgi:hypothetical protein